MKFFITFFKDKILLSLIVLTILCNIITSYCNVDTSTAYIYFFSNYNSYFIAILLVVVIPIIEEVAFRGWVFKRQTLKILFFIVFAACTIFLLKFIGIICAFLMFYSWFLDKNTKRRSITLLVLSSLIFSFLHVGNFETVKLFLITLPAYLSIGLLLGYLAYKTQKITASIIVHILNNAIAFMVFFSPVSGSEVRWEQENLKIYLKKESVFANKNTTMSSTLEGREYSNITIPELVTILKPAKEKTYMSFVPSLAYYSIKATSTNGEIIENSVLADILVEKFNLKTSVEQMKTVSYEIEIIDTTKLFLSNNIEPFFVSMPFSVFFESLGRRYQTPIYVKDSIMNKYSTINLFHSFNRDMTFEKERENLLQNKGIKLTQKDSTLIEIITISY